MTQNNFKEEAAWKPLNYGERAARKGKAGRAIAVSTNKDETGSGGRAGAGQKLRGTTKRRNGKKTEKDQKIK